jgi:hypothetical protein
MEKIAKALGVKVSQFFEEPGAEAKKVRVGRPPKTYQR